MAGRRPCSRWWSWCVTSTRTSSPSTRHAGRRRSAGSPAARTAAPVRRSKREPCSQHSIVQSVDLALGQRDVGVRADVVDGVQVAVLVAHDGDGHVVDLGADHAGGVEVGQRAGALQRHRTTSGGRLADDGVDGGATGVDAAPIDSASSSSIACMSRSCSSGTPICCDDVGEEAAHDQPPRLVLGDAAGLQVEQLLVVEPAGGAGVAGADDLTGLDLEVRHRVGAGAVGEHQVAVQLVGVGALGRGADQHVADPDRVRGLALQRALVGDDAACSAAPRGRRTSGARGAGRRRRSRRPAGSPRHRARRTTTLALIRTDPAAEGDDDVLEPGVAADARRRAAPRWTASSSQSLHAHDGEVGAVADDDLDVAGVHAGAPVVEHDQRPASAGRPRRRRVSPAGGARRRRSPTTRTGSTSWASAGDVTGAARRRYRRAPARRRGRPGPAPTRADASPATSVEAATPSGSVDLDGRGAPLPPTSVAPS